MADLPGSSGVTDWAERRVQILPRVRELAAGLDPTTRRLVESSYQSSPRRLLRPFLTRYELYRKRVLDVGCQAGQALCYFGPGSVGLDFDVSAVEFARSMGMQAHTLDIYDNRYYDLVGRRAFDAIWLCAVVEHLNAPHTALMRLRQSLVDGGYLFMLVPVIPSPVVEATWNLLLRLRNGGRGGTRLEYHSTDHVNAFTASTARFTVERAGFHVEQVYGSLPPLPLAAGLVGRPLASCVVVVARVDHSWQYPSKATRRVDVDEGWRWRSDDEGHPALAGS